MRFLAFYFVHDGSGHIQSLILASIFLGMGVQSFFIAFIADLLAANRKLLEDIRYRCQQQATSVGFGHQASSGSYQTIKK